MVLQVISNLPSTDLLYFLEAFPSNPDVVYVGLFGNFSYESLSEQAQKVVSGCVLDGGPSSVTYDSPLTKYKLASTDKDLVKKIILEEKAFDNDKEYLKNPDLKVVRFYKAQWNYPDNTKAELNTTGLEMNIRSDEVVKL